MEPLECLDGSIVMESRHRFKLEVQLLGNFFKCVNKDSLRTIQEGDPVDLGVRIQEIATSPILCTDITVMRERERERERERQKERDREITSEQITFKEQPKVSFRYTGSPV